MNTTAAGSYRIVLDRETTEMKFRVGASSNVPLYSVLIALGVPDTTIRQMMGTEIYRANTVKAKPEIDNRKLLKKLRPTFKGDQLTKEEIYTEVREFLASKPLDPKVNQVTVGSPIDKISSDALIAGTRKAIKLSKGLTDPDDEESLAFKSIMSLEDFLPEKLTRAIPEIKRRLAFQLDKKTDKAKNIVYVFPPSTFTGISDNFFTRSEFTRYSDQNNPVDMAAVGSLVTVIGEGGIGSSHAITDEIRTIHPSHLGVLDPLHTPEGEKIGVSNHLSLGAKKVGNSLGLEVYDAKTGARETKLVSELENKALAFPDQYQNLGQGKPKATVSRVKVKKGNAYKVVSPREVDYIFISPKQLFSSTTNIVPFLPNNHANRVLMADKHAEQAVQLTDPDKPLVQNRVSEEGGYEEIFGKDFNVLAPIAGVITSVKATSIKIKGKGGRVVEIPIHDHYPLNSHTFLHDTPLVKRGDVVEKGDQLTENNFTKDGVLAMGKNLKVAYTAYKGYNFEDGLVISETAAQKLTSTHKHEFKIEKDKNTKIGAEIFLAAFPQESKNIREKAKRYDSNGIIKKGAVVEYGDVLIPAIQKVELHPEFDFKRLGKVFGERAINISEANGTWGQPCGWRSPGRGKHC